LKENIARPIQEIDSILQENADSIIEENINNDETDDISEEEVSDELSISNFNNLIDKWKQLLRQEEEAEREALIDLNYEFEVEINEFLLNQTHPALDNSAKWQIGDIFIDNLEPLFSVRN
jgi:hypothetical protein